MWAMWYVKLSRARVDFVWIITIKRKISLRKNLHSVNYVIRWNSENSWEYKGRTERSIFFQRLRIADFSRPPTFPAPVAKLHCSYHAPTGFKTDKASEYCIGIEGNKKRKEKEKHWGIIPDILQFNNITFQFFLNFMMHDHPDTGHYSKMYEEQSKVRNVSLCERHTSTEIFRK